MFKNVCCPNSVLQREIDSLRMSDTDYTIITEYIQTLRSIYSSYKCKRCSFKFLRFMQVAGGFAITTLTTYNNPYFKDNTDAINILVWYISISNNIINLIVEKIDAYDLSNEKLRIKLLIDEGKKYTGNEQNYSLYRDDMKELKMKYFKESCHRIRTLQPYDYLTRNEKDADHDDLVMDKKNIRLRELWKIITPERTSAVVLLEDNEVIDELDQDLDQDQEDQEDQGNAN